MLVLVVGPSGAGKDTLLTAAKAELVDDPRFRFVRRAVTRVPHGATDEEPLDEAEFHVRREREAYALWWQAHGFFYGVPADIAGDLGAGRVVVASVSRAVLAAAAARFPVRVVEITAPRDVLARRLVARGREDAAQVAGRLSRTVALPAGLVVTVIVNDGTIAEGTRALLVRLREIADEMVRVTAAAENGSTA
jgi:ribose 1,5-bisphosphokinase